MASQGGSGPGKLATENWTKEWTKKQIESFQTTTIINTEVQPAVGANTEIQFNDSDLFGADENFTFDKVTDTLNIGPDVFVNTEAIGIGADILLDAEHLEIGDVIANTTTIKIDDTEANSTQITVRNIEIVETLIANGVVGNAQILKANSEGGVYWSDSEGGSGEAIGANTEIQFNNSGDLGANNKFTFDKDSSTLSIGSNVTVNTSVVKIGNTIANTMANSILVKVANSTGTANLSPFGLVVGDYSHNTSGFFAGANISLDTAKLTFGNTVANLVANSILVKVANSTGTANLSPNSLDIGSITQNSSGFFVGSNVSLTTVELKVGNTIANTMANSILIKVANSTGTANLSPFGLVVGDTVVNTSVITTSANLVLSNNDIFIGNTIANLVANSILVKVANSTSIANLSPFGLVVGNTVVNSTVITLGNTSVNAQVNSSVLAIKNLNVSGNITANGSLGNNMLLKANSTGGVYWSDSIAQFSNVSTIQATSIDPSLNSIRTLGYYSPNDGGGAIYIRSASEPSTSGGKIQSADGSWWSLDRSQRFDVRMFGVIVEPFGVTPTQNNTITLQNAVDFNPGHLYAPNGFIRGNFEIKKSMTIYGTGCQAVQGTLSLIPEQGTFFLTANSTAPVIMVSANGVNFQNFNIGGTTSNCGILIGGNTTTISSVTLQTGNTTIVVPTPTINSQANSNKLLITYSNGTIASGQISSIINTTAFVANIQFGSIVTGTVTIEYGPPINMFSAENISTSISTTKSIHLYNGTSFSLKNCKLFATNTCVFHENKLSPQGGDSDINGGFMSILGGTGDCFKLTGGASIRISNVKFNSGNNGIVIAQSMLSGGQIEITNNGFEGFLESCIYVSCPVLMDRILINGNVLSTSQKFITIDNNAGSEVRTIAIVGNVVRQENVGTPNNMIHIGKASAVTIVGNSIDMRNLAQRGIYVDSAANNVVISDNTFHNIGSGTDIEVHSTANTKTHIMRPEKYRYDEGTWSPQFTFATPGDLSTGYSTQVGNFVKIGKMVICTFRLVTSSFTFGGTASGTLRITGFPYTANLQSSGVAVGPCQTTSIFKTNYTSPTIRIDHNSIFATLQLTGSGSNLVFSTIQASDLTSGVNIGVSGTLTYQTTQ